MKILITGSNGLLAQKIISLAIKDKIDIIATSKGIDRSNNLNISYYRYFSLDITSKDHAV